MRRWRRSTADVSAAAAASTVREERPRYLLKGRGRGRVVTQRCFGPTRSLAARSAATLTVAASRAAHEHLSPTGGRAKRVARMGRSGGYEVGKGRAEKPRRGCEVAGRAQAGGASTTYVQGHSARSRVGGARTFRLDLALLARQQRQDVVDPEGHEVRGRGECPDPAAGYPAGGWAELAGAPSPAPASSCTAIVSLSRGQAIYGYLTRRWRRQKPQPRGRGSPAEWPAAAGASPLARRCRRGRARRPSASYLPANQCSSDCGLCEQRCGWAGKAGGCTHLVAADPGYHSSRRYSPPRSVALDPRAQPWRGCPQPEPRPKPFLAFRVHGQRPEAFSAGTRGCPAR